MAEDIRVLIAEDSPTVRSYLKSIINETQGFRVVGEAENGVVAVALTQQLKPDIITMDIVMPIADGLSATRQIMAECPTPVVVVSGVLGSEVELSMQALQMGALAVLPKLPERNKPEFATRRQELIQTLKAMSGVKVISRREHLTNGQGYVVKPATKPIALRPKPEVLVMGASTGGPTALQRIFSKLPKTFPLPIVIVQHMPDEFMGGLARWLRSNSPMQVQMAHHGIDLRPGTIYIALGGAHLLLKRSREKLRTLLVSERGDERFQPSINILFESVSIACGSSAIGVILTGMGDDGAEGLLKLRKTGAYTFAQDEKSSTVFGMPNSAIERGAVERVVDLENMPTELLKLV